MTRQLHAYPTYIGTTAERTAFDPGSEAITLEWWDSDDEKPYWWNGAAWVDVATVGLPQDLGTGDSPTFAGLTLNGDLSIDGDISLVGAQQISTTTGQLTIGTGGGGGDLYLAADGDIVIDDGTALVSSVPGAGISINEDIDLDGDLDFVGASEITTTVGNLTLTPAGELIISSAATASRLAYLGASKELESVSNLTSWIAGTANRVTVADDGDGTLTLSGPQDLHAGASPTFATAKLTNLTDGYVPYHVSDAAGLADSPIYIDGTNVGIGTTNPGKKLDVNSEIYAQGLRINRPGSLSFIYRNITSEQYSINIENYAGQIRLITGTNGTDRLERMRVAMNGDVGIGTTAIGAQLHADQSSSTGEQPVLLLDQADVSEEFERYVGQAAAAVLTQSLVDVGDVSTFTVVGYRKIYVQDDGNQVADGPYYVPFGTLA